MAKSFSIATDSGVTGFPVGKEVTLIREENGNFIISDGVQLTTAPKASFTRDVEVINAIKQRGGAGTKPAAQAQTSSLHRPMNEESSRVLNPQSKDVNEQKRQLRQVQLAAIEQRIAAAEKEIAAKQAGQRPVRRTYDASGALKIYQGKSAYTLSADASESGMKELARRRQALQAELEALR